MTRSCGTGRRAWTGVAVLVLGCQHAASPAPRPRGPTACERASDGMVLALLARLPSSEPPPTETADALRNLIRERCERDDWSADATRCLAAMRRVDDAGRCASLLTDAQQAALLRDEEARLDAAGPAGRRSEPGRSAGEPGRSAGEPGRSVGEPGQSAGKPGRSPPGNSE